MTPKPDQHVMIVPAQPGFWVHLLSEGVVGCRMAIIAWLVDCRAMEEEWIGRVEIVTSDGVTNQDHFIEQPDGTCVSYTFSAPNVEEAKEAALQEHAEYQANLAELRAKRKPA